MGTKYVDYKKDYDVVYNILYKQLKLLESELNNIGKRFPVNKKMDEFELLFQYSLLQVIVFSEENPTSEQIDVISNITKGNDLTDFMVKTFKKANITSHGLTWETFKNYDWQTLKGVLLAFDGIMIDFANDLLASVPIAFKLERKSAKDYLKPEVYEVFKKFCLITDDIGAIPGRPLLRSLIDRFGWED